MPLTAQQERIQDDLRGLVAGDVRCDSVIAKLYSTDASDFEALPVGVIWPKSTQDVAAAVRYCAEHGISIHPRGSGTGTSGGAIGRGLVLDFTRYMRRIIKVSDDATIVVQPGAVRERLNDLLKRSGNRFFAPNSSFLPTGTVGSIVSTNTAGPRWLRYGFPHESVLSMEVVLAGGEIVTLRPMDLGSADRFAPGTPAALRRTADLFLAGDLPPLADGAARHGYGLDGVMVGKRFNPARLFCGAEGSLGVITSLTVRTEVRPKCTVSVILLFDLLDAAAHSVERILPFKPAVCELIDRRIINLVTLRDNRFQRYLPSDTESALLLEFDSDSVAELSNRVSAMTRVVRENQKHCFGTWSSIDERKRLLFADLLRESEVASRTVGPTFKSSSLLGDVCIPVEKMADFFVRLQRLLRGRELTCALSGHIGQGELRIQPILPASSPIGAELFDAAGEVLDLTTQFGGGFVSGLGAGWVRAPFLPRYFPKEVAFSRRIKALFDPGAMMNPGKVIPLSDKPAAAWPGALRSYPAPGDLTEPEAAGAKTDAPGEPSSAEEAVESDAAIEQLRTQLKWDRHQVAPDVFQCGGCGFCRSRNPGMRTCPNFRHYPDEQASCRAKANALRGILDGNLPLEALVEDEVRLLGEQCIMCHCCASDCPSKVDVARLAFRIRTAQNAAHGTSVADRFLAYFDRILRVASAFSYPSNWLIHGPVFRWAGEKLLGIAQGRKYPRMENVSFLSRLAYRSHRVWARRNSSSSISSDTAAPRRKVALFIDTYVNYFDTPLADAAMKILDHNNIDVIVPTRQRSSGHQAFVLGHSDHAQELCRANVALYADLIRQGCRMVTIEPLSAVCIGREYLWLQNDPDTRLVAENVTDIHFFLQELHQKGELALDLAPIPLSIAYHLPCRTIALSGQPHLEKSPAQELLELIPQMKVHRLERGCCGLAGPSGMKKDNHAMSLRLGVPLFLALREPIYDYGATECSFCQMQMEHGGGKKVIHPLKLLARAYGFGGEEYKSAREPLETREPAEN